MPNAGGPDLRTAKHQIAAVESALKAGHPPAGHKYHAGAVMVAARALGITFQTLTHRVGTPARTGLFWRQHKLKVDWKLYKGPKLEEVKIGQTSSHSDRKIVELRDEITRLRSQVRKQNQQDNVWALVESVVGSVLETPAAPPNWLTKVMPGKVDEEVPMTIWADWHVGQVVKPEEVGFANAYDIESARRRAAQLISATFNLARNHHNGRYPGIVVNLLGDFVSGSIHMELEKTNEQPVAGQILECRNLLLWGLRELVREFRHVFVVCSSGNHGRSTRKPEFSGYVFQNWDWLIYQLLASEFKGNPRVQFSIPTSNDNYYSVLGLRFLATHGDMLGARGGDGLIGAIGPIMRGEIRTGRQASSLGSDYDYLLCGHWHQELWLPRAIVANAFCGFDNYAHKSLRAVPSRPSQPLWFVHPKHGITARWNVLVEKSEARPGKWVEVWGKSSA